MKKLLFLFSIAVLVSCKKDKITVTETACKLSKILHITATSSDTTFISYSGDDGTYTTIYSNNPILYTYKYIKSGSQYDVTGYWDTIKKYTGVSILNSQGLYDTAYLYNISLAKYNNREKRYYDTAGNVIRMISNYNTYEDDVKYHYINGNYSYWIYDINYTTPLASFKDSIVFEYYTDKPKVNERIFFEKKYGNLEKNLVKRRLYYNLLDNKVLRQTYDYEYLTDAKGLVTREIWITKQQPGDVESRRDTSYYEYKCN